MTKDLVEVCAGVTEFLNRSSKLIAAKAEDDFNQGAWRDFQDRSITSPIEQYLYTAIRLLQHLDDLPDSDPVRVDNEFFIIGLNITPQFKVGKYAADFHISYGEYPNWKDKSQITRTVIVECDSQQWHDRSEHERRYEKARERFFVKSGYKIFRYTGAEILANPIKVASEILAFVTERTQESFIEQVSYIQNEVLIK